MVDLMEFNSSMSGRGRGSFDGPENDCGCESGTRSIDADVSAVEGAVGRGGVCKSVGQAFSLLLLEGAEFASCSCDEG